MTHVIRLRAAWTRAIEAHTNGVQTSEAMCGACLSLSGPSPSRISLPDGPHDCLLGEQLVYRRSFNTPTGIDSSTPLRLCIERWMGALEVTLDEFVLWRGGWWEGADLPTTTEGVTEAARSGGLALDISGRVTQSHRLTLTLRPRELGSASPETENTTKSQVGLTGTVWLEIETG